MNSYQPLRVMVCALSFLLVAAVPSIAELTPDANARVPGQAVTLQNDDFVPEKGMMPVALELDDGVAETSIGDNGQFIWLNRFTPDPMEFPFQLEQVSTVFAGTMVNVGDAIEIVVYEDTDGDDDPGTGAVLLASFNDTVQFNDLFTFSTYDLPAPVMLNGPGDVLIGIINRYSFEGFADFPAALDQTASAERSWAATYLVGDVPANPTLPGDEQWGTIDSFAFPGNWIIRGAGTTIEPTIPPTEIPTQSTVGLVAFSLLLLLAAAVMMWRRSA